MKNHKSLRPEDLIRHGPAKIARMAASEFLRASAGSEYRSDVIRSYERGRELMGVLETVDLSEEAGLFLQPLYTECTLKKLLREETLTPSHVRDFALRIAQALESAALMILAAKPSHA
jgi:hypothetical protein